MIRRIKRFVRAGRIAVVVQSCIFIGMIGYSAWLDLQAGRAAITVPIFISCFALAYLFRRTLVRNRHTSHRILNATAAIIIIYVLFVLPLQQNLYSALWFRALFSGIVGLHFGAVFWLISDPKWQLIMMVDVDEDGKATYSLRDSDGNPLTPSEPSDVVTLPEEQPRDWPE